MKRIKLFFAFLSFSTFVFAQNQCLIDFGTFPGSGTFDANECQFTVGGLPVKFYDVYNNNQLVCSFTGNLGDFTIAEIKKKDLSMMSNQVYVEVVQQDCGAIEFEFDYGTYIESVFYPFEGIPLFIENYEDLETIRVIEPECGLYDYFFDPDIIKFVSLPEAPNPMACPNPEIAATESMLANPLNMFRFDYHTYEVETTVCSVSSYSGSYKCTVEDLWDFLKSDNTHQVPTINDYPDLFNPFNVFSDIFVHTSNGPYNVPVTNCSQVNLHLSPGRLIVVGPALYLSCFYTNPIHEPVMIAIEEERYCMTNYTLPGHIFHPGKVERCIVADDCGENIKIITKGSGFTSCSSLNGQVMISTMNTLVGPPTFNNVNQRVVNRFNN